MNLRKTITKKTIIGAFLVIFLSSLILSACSVNSVENAVGDINSIDSISETGDVIESSGDMAESAIGTTFVSYDTVIPDVDHDDLDAGWDSAEAFIISLEGDSIVFDGEGAVVDGSTITITSGGTYVVSGMLNDGQIIIDSDDEELVRLVLNGASISSSSSAPIYVMNAEKTVITLAEGTQNEIADGETYVLEDPESDEPNAAIFSKDDLTINGSGSLMVNANYNNGIASKDDLLIVSGNITVNAAANGIKGKDSVIVKDGNITVTAAGDGLEASQDTDAEKGYVAIEGGTLNITAELDGIQAETSVFISGGDITISAGGESANNTATVSTKGIKAAVYIQITGGTLNIESADDAIHSNGSARIDGGSLIISSGDDGIHADAAIEINGGEINITESYEGIESSNITINDGVIHVVSSDDGINIAGGTDGVGVNGQFEQDNFTSEGNNILNIFGGNVYVNASGDGLDSNGSILMTGGLVLVSGPTNSKNGGLDCNGECVISGGFLVVAGSYGMAEVPDATSLQNSIMIVFSSVQPAGTLVHVETADGEDLLTFAPEKEYQTVVFSAPELETGASYVVYYGGEATGAVADGLYFDGTYSAGTEITYSAGTEMVSFTISDVVTGVSETGLVDVSSFGQMGGGKPGRGMH